MGVVRQWFGEVIERWDEFWFAPRLPHTLAVLRIATGAMLLYTHLVLAMDLMAFIGPDAWIGPDEARRLHDGSFAPPETARSYLWMIRTPWILWTHHLLTIVVTFCMMVGLATRVTVPLAWLLQLMLVHRLTGALFGLDQITTMLAMYLMLAPCGAVYSMDALLRRRFPARGARRFWLPDDGPTVATGVATRLAQLHLCVIYLFGGLWKARGVTWWDGSAIWSAAGNYEYQSTDLTWIASYPVLFAAMAHATVFWETFYCALVWPKLTRPLVLAMAVVVHGGIAVFLGMVTFGTMMIVANGVFVEPETVRAMLARRRAPETPQPSTVPARRPSRSR